MFKNKISKNEGRFINFDTTTKKVTLITKDGTEQAYFSDLVLIEESENTSGAEKSPEDKTASDSFKSNQQNIRSLQVAIQNIKTNLESAIELTTTNKFSNSEIFKTFLSQLNNFEKGINSEMQKLNKDMN